MALVNIDEDSWLTEYSGLERLSQQIQRNISDRDCQNATSEYNKLSARVRIQLKQFENEMTQLQKKLKLLAKSSSVLTDQECERRARQLEVLASKKIQLDERFRITPGSTSRSKLFDANSNTKLFDDDDDEPVLDKTTPIETLRDEQKQILKEQDKGLESLSQVIARQKKLAMRIGTEIEDQSEIIDNIAVQMDNTSQRVNSETRNVEVVSAKDSTWSYWLIIIGLFVAIIVVGIL